MKNGSEAETQRLCRREKRGLLLPSPITHPKVLSPRSNPNVEDEEGAWELRVAELESRIQAAGWSSAERVEKQREKGKDTDTILPPPSILSASSHDMRASVCVLACMRWCHAGRPASPKALSYTRTSPSSASASEDKRLGDGQDRPRTREDGGVLHF